MNAVASWKSKKIRITQQIAISVTKVQSVEGFTGAWRFTHTLANYNKVQQDKIRKSKAKPSQERNNFFQKIRNTFSSMTRFFL